MRKYLAALCGFFIACGMVQAQNTAGGPLTAAGATCATAGACIALHFESNEVASSAIQLSGTFTATVQFEASSDGGTTWVAISGTPLNSSTAASSATTANTWKFNAASLTDIRARCSAFTSAPTVVIRSSKAVANAVGGGGAVYASGNGTNNVVPKGNGSGQLADSSITDNATTVQTALPLNLTQAASTTNAIVQFNSVATTGLMFGASSYVGLKVDATSWIGTSNNGTATVLSIPSTGCMGWSSTTTFGGNINDTGLCRNGAANSARLGLSGASSAPLSNALQIGETGTGSDKIGGSGSVKPGIGTGAGAGTQLDFSRNLILATSSTVQSQSHALVVCESKILSNTSATATTLATIGLASNSGGGAEVHISVVASDGTNFDVETQSATLSFVNKATVMTVSTPTITASSAASNSGSTTIGFTATGASPTISLKVTPVFTTIVPTTVTAYMEVLNHGAGAVACQ